MEFNFVQNDHLAMLCLSAYNHWLENREIFDERLGGVNENRSIRISGLRGLGYTKALDRIVWDLGQRTPPQEILIVTAGEDLMLETQRMLGQRSQAVYSIVPDERQLLRALRGYAPDVVVLDNAGLILKYMNEIEITEMFALRPNTFFMLLN